MVFLYQLIITFLLPVLIGYIFLRLILQKIYFPKSLTLGLSYGLGSGLYSQWLLGLATFNVSFSYLNMICLPLLFVTGGYSYVYLQNKKNSFRIPLSEVQTSFSVIRLALAGLVLYYTAYIFWSNAYTPIYLWDALNLHAYKAKVFFHSNSLTCLSRFPYAGYPIHISLQLFVNAVHLGYWDEQILKTLFSVNYVMFMCIIFGFLKFFLKECWAWFGLVLLVSSSLFVTHAVIAYSDFMIMFYHCATVILLVYWNHFKKDRILLLASLFAGCASFTKLEGLGMVVIYLLIMIFIIYREKRFRWRTIIKRFLLFLVLFMVYYAHYIIHKYMYFPQLTDPTLSSEKVILETSFVWPEWSRVSILFFKYIENMYSTNNWSVLWFVFSVLCIIRLGDGKIKNSLKESTILLLGLILTAGYYFVGLIFTTRFEYVSNDSVLSRAFLVFFPLLVCLVAFYFAMFFPAVKTKKNEINQPIYTKVEGVSVLIWFFSICSGLLWLSAITLEPLDRVFHGLVSALHAIPSMNIYLIPPYSELNIYYLFYFLFLMLSVILFLFKKVVPSPGKISSFKLIPYRQAVVYLLLFMLLSAVSVQLYSHHQYFKAVRKGQVDQESFYRLHYGQKFLFLQQAKELIPAGASIAFNFETKIDDDPPLIDKILFNYFLYPENDLRHVCTDSQPYKYVIVTQDEEDTNLSEEYDMILRDEEGRKLLKRKNGS